MALSDTSARNSKHSGKAAGDKLHDGGGLYLLVKAEGKYGRMAYQLRWQAKDADIWRISCRVVGASA
jgi:hypothetical protein